MKRILLAMFACILSVTMYAQKDVTKFLGIPVDGTKSAMIKKLKAKGFKYDSVYESLTGLFNGGNVNVFVATNNDKVCRIMVCDASTMDEGEIRIRFNRLCEQFKNNSKYIAFDDFTISESEDISYEMTVHSKKYDAIFYQKPESEDAPASSAAMKPVWFRITDHYGEYYITMFYDNEYNRANGEDL